jgi:hypothetical protein
MCYIPWAGLQHSSIKTNDDVAHHDCHLWRSFEYLWQLTSKNLMGRLAFGTPSILTERCLIERWRLGTFDSTVTLHRPALRRVTQLESLR